MSEQQVAARDPFYDMAPGSVWVVCTNICDKGKFRVTLDVNGHKRDLFYSYPSQEDGTISDHTNLTWLIENARKAKDPPPPAAPAEGEGEMATLNGAFVRCKFCCLPVGQIMDHQRCAIAHRKGRELLADEHRESVGRYRSEIDKLEAQLAEAMAQVEELQKARLNLRQGLRDSMNENYAGSEDALITEFDTLTRERNDARSENEAQAATIRGLVGALEKAAHEIDEAQYYFYEISCASIMEIGGMKLIQVENAHRARERHFALLVFAAWLKQARAALAAAKERGEKDG